MSEETASSPVISTKPEAVSAPRARRVSTPRPKKVAKTAAPEEPAAEIPSIPLPTSSAPDREDDSDAPSHAGGEWPEPESEAAGGSQSPSEGGPKRKRRRRKGKGQAAGPQNGGGSSDENVYTLAIPEPTKSAEAPQARPAQPPQQPQQQPQRSKVDPELLTKMAWKIYLAEVSEEGVALIGDNDAKDLSRRCFRLAEIFIEEQSRRR